MDFGQQRLDQIQQQIRQLQGIMNGQTPTIPQAPQAPQKAVTTIPLVDGIAGARQFAATLAPNSKAAPFDSKEPVFYAISIDANGNLDPIQIGEFTLKAAPEPSDNTITRDDFNAFKAEIIAMLSAKSKEEREE